MALACDGQNTAWFGPNAARTARKACDDQFTAWFGPNATRIAMKPCGRKEQLCNSSVICTWHR